MPIYEYTCKRCGNFEIMQRISEEPLKECPTCGGTKVSKLISLSAFQLKGSGWYATDYARNSSSKSKSEETKSTTNEAKDKSTSNTSSTAASPSSESSAKASTSAT